MNSFAQFTPANGFWSMRADREWTSQELDKAFDLFKRLKGTHGDQFNLVVQDLHKEGRPGPDGRKTAQILIKIYVNPPNPSIARELEGVGMVFVKE